MGTLCSLGSTANALDICVPTDPGGVSNITGSALVSSPTTTSLLDAAPTTGPSTTNPSTNNTSIPSISSSNSPPNVHTTIIQLPTVVGQSGAYYCGGDSASAIYCTQTRNEPTPITTVFGAAAMGSYTTTQIFTGERNSLTLASSTSATSSSSSTSTFTSPSPSSSPTTLPSSTSVATNAAKTNTSTASQNSKRNPGAVAGAAVGGFLAGLAIAGLIGFFILRKRKNQRYARPANYTPAPAHPHGGEKGTPLVAVSPASPEYLPQQADDAEIRRRISTVIDQIDQHVENFYINHAIQLTPQMESELSRFETSQLPQPLAMCFAMSSQPTVLIKHCLAFHMFNLTMAPGEGTTPILPPEIANMVSATYSKSIASNVSKEFIQAFSSWKRLTAYLRPDLLRDPRTLNKSAEASARIASHFTAVFAPWRNDVYSDEQRTGHLTELLDHAVFTALWLFGQPDNFRFDWVAPPSDINRSASMRGGGGRGGSSGVVVGPGVTKVTYAGARLPGLGQQVLAPVLRRV